MQMLNTDHVASHCLQYAARHTGSAKIELRKRNPSMGPVFGAAVRCARKYVCEDDESTAASEAGYYCGVMESACGLNLFGCVMDVSRGGGVKPRENTPPRFETTKRVDCAGYGDGAAEGPGGCSDGVYGKDAPRSWVLVYGSWCGLAKKKAGVTRHPF